MMPYPNLQLDAFVVPIHGFDPEVDPHCTDES